MSRMTHSKCGDCRNYFKCDSACKNDWACEDFEPQGKTLFDRITASPEVLAEVLVFQMPFSGWHRSIILDRVYRTKPEAIAATVEKLKEVAE